MAKKDGSLTIRNLTPEQYNLVEDKAKRDGTNNSFVIKSLINDYLRGKNNNEIPTAPGPNQMPVYGS